MVKDLSGAALQEQPQPEDCSMFKIVCFVREVLWDAVAIVAFVKTLYRTQWTLLDEMPNQVYRGENRKDSVVE